MLIDSRTIYAAKLNLRVPVRLQAKKCPLLANIYCTAVAVAAVTTPLARVSCSPRARCTESKFSNNF